MKVSHRYSVEFLFVVSDDRNTAEAYGPNSLIQTLEVLVHNRDNQPQILNVHSGLDSVLV